ncbi:hypothetical protein GCM10022407_03190 [Hymenobacter antarcticus]|uniref:Uncharacterized protein n=2 Tax=Hymenobacter antarcticus TaxID=486270 RepID=A0ABP7P4B5_9BACT
MDRKSSKPGGNRGTIFALGNLHRLPHPAGGTRTPFPNPMKVLTSFAPLLFAGVLTFAASGCGKKCSNEDPRARITNNGTQNASVQIKTSGGSTVNINNVAAGASSDYANYAAGSTTFTLKVNNIDYVKTTDVSKCHEYTIAIDRNNVITVTDTDRNN